MMRAGLQDVASIFGLTLQEESPKVGFSHIGDGSPEQQFASQVSVALRSLVGRTFQTPKGSLSISETKRPAMQHKRTGLVAIVPLVVAYDGKASAEEWAGVEREAENEILAVLQANSEVLGAGSFKLVRRAKTDPFSDDPASLTILRFRFVV